jgi:hypothetical protein
LNLVSNYFKTPPFPGKIKNVSAFSGQIVSLNVGKDDVITSVEFSADAAKAVGDYNKDAPVITLNHSPTPAVEPAHK